MKVEKKNVISLIQKRIVIIEKRLLVVDGDSKCFWEGQLRCAQALMNEINKLVPK